MALVAKIQTNGQVYIYDGTNYKCCCGDHATSAQIQGDECVVNRRVENGQESTYVYDANTGNYKYCVY